MKAVTWQGREKIERATRSPDPRIEQPNDIGDQGQLDRDLRLRPAPVLRARAVSRAGRRARPRDHGRGHRGRRGGHRARGPATGWSSRSTSPAAAAGCATAGCSPSARPPRSASQGTGAALFGYTELYGSVPGGQAEYLRVPQAQFGPIKVPDDVPDERVLYLSDILPTAWQGVEYADVPEDGTLAVLGSRPGRPAGHPDRPAPRSPGDRGRPCARAAGHWRPPRCGDPRPGHRRRRRRRADRADRRARAGRRARGGRHGGARRPGPEGRDDGGRTAARRGRQAADREGRHRPDGRPAHRGHRRPPRRHGLDQRRLRRPARPDADDDHVRPGHHHPDGPVPRQALDR